LIFLTDEQIKKYDILSKSAKIHAPGKEKAPAIFIAGAFI